MSMNWALVVGAIFVASMGTIAGACNLPGAQGTPETSATPNSNSVRNNNAAEAISSKSKAEASRDLGVRFAAC